MSTYVAVFAMVLAYVALVAAYIALRTIAKLRRTIRAGTSTRQAATPAQDTNGALRNIALVRYDAFGEMSGRMSFSLALLDDKGDGVTISAIAGRSDTSVYAKGITAGRGEHDLSPEEQQAVSTALHRPRYGLLGKRAS